MAYSKKERESKVKEIFDLMSNKGYSLRKSCKNVKITTDTFYRWCDKSKDIQLQYARANEQRADYLFDEMLTIADDNNPDISVVDGKIKIDGSAIQRSKLMVDTRKWALSKMNPKKYGINRDVTIEEENTDDDNIIELIVKKSK